MTAHRQRVPHFALTQRLASHYPLQHVACDFAGPPSLRFIPEVGQTNCSNQRVRLKAELDRAREQIALQEEEIRIKDARMACIPPNRRPTYPPTERMAILELKAARGWSLKQTASTFQITAATISSWLKTP